MVKWYEIFDADLTEFITTTSNKKIARYNNACAFDIETTSIIINGKKHGFMYIWMFGLEDVVFYGRTWEEFVQFCDVLSSRLDLNNDKRLVVYVHNLQFEFQFIYKLFKWNKVFSLKSRRPIYAITEEGIEFRCSYLLSGLSLAKVGENLLKHNLKKKVGDLDYSLIRHYKTLLSEKELGYCEYDIKVLIAYINEQIDEHNYNINHIPMTNTGRVRNFCRKKTLYNSHESYSRLMRQLTLTVEEYEQMKRGFQGGFTHANYFYSGKTVDGVKSYDLASSYPSTMVCDLYPMSEPKLVEIEDSSQLEEYLEDYCCIFDIEIHGLYSISMCEHTLSESRCWDKSNVQVDNGRIVSADKLSTTMTELDYDTLLEFYDFESATITNFRIMKKGYLPRSFILAILDLYAAKTTLKNVQGKEAEYMRSKNMINSAYGMTVTDIARPEITFQSTGIWDKKVPDLEKAISAYNKSKRRFLYYPWGVWVTAYARHNLFSAIKEFDTDYIYSDTDSVKVINAEKHMDFIHKYNDNILKKMTKMCNVYGIDIGMVKPKAPDGKEKLLGVWEFDGDYDKFKTLGAKRYMYSSGDKISITVSGVNKSKAIPYIEEKFDDPFEAFSDGLYIPPEHTGKLTHTYIDEEDIINVTDYNGITATVHYYSGIHLEPASYELSLSEAYVKFLKGYRDEKA